MNETDSRPPDETALSERSARQQAALEAQVPLAKPVASVLTGAQDLARQLALKHGLVAEDGQLYCWECHRLGGTLPSLHCLRCLTTFRERDAQQRAREAVEHPDNKRWRAALSALGNNTFDRETAEKFVRAAEQMPGATPERTRQLWHIFEQRWPEKSAPRNWGGRGWRRAEEG
jgi:hypothetical protein